MFYCGDTCPQELSTMKEEKIIYVLVAILSKKRGLQLVKEHKLGL
jgi:hypothetical protein